MVSGGRDGHVKIWTCSPSLRPVGDFDLRSIVEARAISLGLLPTRDGPPSVVVSVRSVSISRDGERLLVCTRGSEVYELESKSGLPTVEGRTIKCMPVYFFDFVTDLIYGVTRNPCLWT